MKDPFPALLRPFWLTVCLVVIGFGCDRGVEPFDPNEEPKAPDLARIFPETGEARPPGAGASGQSGQGAPPSQGRSAEAADATSSGPQARFSGAPESPIRGSVDIAPSLRAAASSGGVLFVIARTQPAGPPLAVLRIPNPSFPYEFEIGQENVMIPSLRFEGEVTLSVRLDSDGNAMTKLPGDLEGKLEQPHSPGDAGIRLLLDREL